MSEEEPIAIVETRPLSALKLGVLPLLTLIAVLLTWFIAGELGWLNGRVFPGPKDVLRVLNRLDPAIHWQTIATGGLVVLGFVAGLFISLIFSFLALSNKVFDAATKPLVYFLAGIPPVCYIPFFILWFGFDPLGKVLLVAISNLLIIWPASVQLAQRIDQSYWDVWRSVGRNRSRFVLTEALRAIGPQLLPTLRFSMSFSVMIAIVAEAMGATIGLGHIISVALNTFSLASVVAAALAGAVLAFVLDYFLVRTALYLMPWIDN